MWGLSVVTGIARHSFGASFVRARLEKSCERLIGIDRIANPDLPSQTRLQNINLDLNPLTFVGGYNAFAETLPRELSDALRNVGATHTDRLIQFAGTYEFGDFLAHDLGRRHRVLGLNVLGATELLHAVMALNDKSKYDNSRGFTHVWVGSFQGLNVRSQRSLYVASKAYGLDLCASLAKGNEISTCLYLAFGPMDTAMLHWNHWTRKANGSNAFFGTVFAGDALLYKSVFKDCDEKALVIAAGDKFASDLPSLQSTLREYRAIRRAAFDSELGVLDPDKCADLLSRLVDSDDLRSGVYSFAGRGDKVIVKSSTFEALDRFRLFESVATPVRLA